MGNRYGQVLLSVILLSGLIGAAVQSPTPSSAAVPRVAIQAGHWRAEEAPGALRSHTGGSVAGVDERDITLDIAQRVADRLRSTGIEVEILPTWFPQNYAADAFVSLHVNGSPSSTHRGFFADRAEDSVIPAREDQLVDLIEAEYAQATGLPYVYRPTINTRRYYGYYRVTGTTPAVLVELGFLTNDADRAFLVTSPQQAADGLARAISRFLGQAPPTEPLGRATLDSEGFGGAFLRLEPTRQSLALRIVPDGQELEIVGSQWGEAVEAGNQQWYRVRWQEQDGYIYAGLVDLWQTVFGQDR